jgi:pimeloyl-ACP methyl ester carboxylesterase
MDNYSLDAWSLNVGPLARHFRVYAVDKLGQGLTDNPRTDEEYTFDATLRHVTRLMETLGIREAHIGGHSRGALPAACLALERPDLVKTLIVVDSSTLAPDDPNVNGNALYAEVDRLTPPGSPTRESVLLEPVLQAHSTDHITDDFANRMLALAREPKYEEAKSAFKRIAASQWMPNLNRHRAETLEKIDARGVPVPTLMIWAFNDKSAPLQLAQSLFARICPKTPRAELHILNGSGHYSFREQYEGFNRSVVSFCRS